MIYFDLFNHPLTSNEIYLFLQKKVDQTDFNLALRYLVSDQSVYHFGDYYTLQNNHMLVVQRGDANKKAAELKRVAEKISDALMRIPFVRAIGMSAPRPSLLNQDCTIDLFIITTKNRLWIARFIMLAFKKLKQLISKQDCYSLNYFIDEGALTVKDQTIYTAIDVATLIPLQGDIVAEQYHMANSWICNYLPHQIMRISSAKAAKPYIAKLLFERLFDNALGNAIDNALMGITTGRWEKQARAQNRNFNSKAMGIDAGKHQTMPDLRNFQADLIAQYERSISQIMIAPQSLLAN